MTTEITGNSVLHRFSEAGQFKRASLRAAMFIRGLWEEKGSSDTRLLEGLFLPNKWTCVGRSRKFTEKGRREHVIPRKLIIEQCHRMLSDGDSDEAIANFIREHVKIVMISSEECEVLDRIANLGLRTTMPGGWKFGDNPFERLTAAGIV